MGARDVREKNQSNESEIYQHFEREDTNERCLNTFELQSRMNRMCEDVSIEIDDFSSIDEEIYVGEKKTETQYIIKFHLSHSSTLKRRRE